MLTFNPSSYSTYEASDLGNIRFCADSSCNTELDSWLESCNSTCGTSATAATVWVLLPSSISAGGFLTIYMAFYPKSTEFDGNYWGEAPQLSTTYAQFDNGRSVFSFYDNFAGTSLSSQWSSVTNGGSVTVDNGLTISNTAGTFCGYSSVTEIDSQVPTAQFTGPKVFDINFQAGQGLGPNFRFGFRDTDLCNVQDGNTGDGVTADFGWSGGTVDYSSGPTYTAGIQIATTDGGNGRFSLSTTSLTAYTAYNTFTIAATSDNAQFFLNYQATSPASISANLPAYSSSIGIGVEQNYDTTPVNVDWIRTRAYPPNDVMPGATFGSLTTPVSSTTTTTVSCTPSVVAVGSSTSCTAAVTGSSPSGTITWSSTGAGTFSPSVCSLSSERCSVSYSPKSTASTNITAAYSGDSNNQGSAGTVSLPVVKASSSTSVACTPSSVTEGSSSSCLATVSGYSPGGTVTFSSSSGTGTFTPSNQCTLSSGSCQVGYYDTAQGTPQITAVYGGDANNDGSDRSTSVTVVPVTTSSSSASATTSSSSTTSSIPEFPYNVLATAVLVIAVALAYAMVRRSALRKQAAP